MTVVAALNRLREGELFALRGATNAEDAAGVVVLEAGAYRGQATPTKTRDALPRGFRLLPC
jgi:hypothetical protein